VTAIPPECECYAPSSDSDIEEARFT
jgi:hypothetical protein